MKQTILSILTILLSFSIYGQDSLEIQKPIIEAYSKASEDKLEIETTSYVHYTVKQIKEKLREYDQAIINLRKERQVWRDRLTKAQELNVEEVPEKDGE